MGLICNLSLRETIYSVASYTRVKYELPIALVFLKTLENDMVGGLNKLPIFIAIYLQLFYLYIFFVKSKAV